MTWKNMAVLGIFALALGASGAARADYGLVTNGGFEDTANVTPPNYPASAGGGPGNPGSGGIGMPGYNTTITGWTSPDTSYVNQTGYNFVFSPATADTTGSQGYNGGLALYGPANGFNNGLTASPDGGQYFGGDSDLRYHGRIEQTISGLTIGDTYTLGFSWALAQQYGAGGNPSAHWQVSLGGETHSTSTVQIVGGGFSGWMGQTFNFTADGTSDVLSFLAMEDAGLGGPPFLLLDGVSLRSVPEPTSLSLMAFGMLGLGTVILRRRAMSKSAKA